MDIPIFYFYPDDLQANGTISNAAIARECCSFQPCITSKLVSELKYLDHANEPISIRIGNRDVFQVQFIEKQGTRTNLSRDSLYNCFL